MRHHMGAAFKNPRSIRLERDLQDMRDLKRDSTIFDFEAFGDPPEKYIVTFLGDTLVPTGRGKKFESEAADVGSTKIGGPQQVEIMLGGDYPRRGPQMRWLTPIQHPNIWGGGTVCLGNYANQWTPYWKLPQMMEILWDMARLFALNPSSAGTGAHHAEEAWKKIFHKFGFPVDERPLRDKVLGKDDGSSLIRPGPFVPDIIIFPEDQEGCER